MARWFIGMWARLRDPKTDEELRREIDGPQAEQLEFVPWGQKLQDEEKEELNSAQIRDHIFLIREVKETFPTTHAQKGSSEVKREGASPHSKGCQPTHRPLH